MKYMNIDLRGSGFRVFRVVFAGLLLFAVGLLALSLKGHVAAAAAPLMTVTGVDSILTKALMVKPGSKIAPQVLEDTLSGKQASVVIYLASQADLSAAFEMKDQDARGWFVYNTLKRHADQTQADIKSFLTVRGIEYQSFWVANMLIAKVDRATADEIAARPDIARIDSNRQANWIEKPAIADFHESASRPDSPETVEVGVTNVNAPSVWALGFTGQNMVIGNQDTGMRWTHSALKPHYRGWNGTAADHNFNWHDSIHTGGGSCGANAVAPCDDNGHGTHTTGTTSGDDGTGNQVGVAPGAKWIGCRNMDQGNGTPATYSECFQFFMAPTDLAGNNANPTLRPHVMNNSWGCPVEEGCTTGAELETIVNNTLASGIFVVVSAGNDGPGCSTISNGAEAGPPAPYLASFSVGAISATTNTLVGFSSRGPSLFYTPNLLKPNISAPGSNVRSSTRTSDTSFGSLSGTSMAGPHVVGVVALLWSARPQLVRDIAATKTILQNSANPNVTVTGGQTCGGTTSTQIPNNSFGYGRIDALAAVNAAGSSSPTPTSTASSTSTNTPNNSPTATPTPASATISGTVTYGNAVGSPATRFVSNVLVNGAGSPPVSGMTDASGDYLLSGFGSGSYTITPSKAGGQNGAISSFDAAKIAQFVIGATTLTAAQQVVADVSGNGGVSSFDSALVAGYAVSSPNSGSSGQWVFSPSSHTHATVGGGISGEDYAALLMGDVSGNWMEAGSLTASGNGPERPTAIAVPSILASAGNEVIIPVSVEGIVNKGIISYEFDLAFDPAVLEPQANAVDLAGTASEGLSVAVSTLNAGILRVAVYGPMPINEDGTLLNLKFKAIGTMGSSSPLTWERIVLNEGGPRLVTTAGQVKIDNSTERAVSSLTGGNFFRSH
jgi:serine protease AprX